MKSLLQTLFCFGLIFLISNSKMKAQIQVPVGNLISQDSLALIAFYDSLGGDSWINTLNQDSTWKSGPVRSWKGVRLNSSGTRVAAISLPENNLRGSIPGVVDTLDALQRLFVDQNRIEGLPVLTRLNGIQEANVSQNKLTFTDVIPFINRLRAVSPNVVITYGDQDSVDFFRVIPAYADDSLLLATKVDLDPKISQTYQWFKTRVGGQPIGNGPELRLLAADSSITGSYFFTITNDNYPQLTLIGRAQVVNYYDFENPFPEGPLSFVLRFRDKDLADPSYIARVRDTLKNIGGSLGDSCLCGAFEVWLFDSLKIGNEIIIDPNSGAPKGFGVIPPRTGNGEPSNRDKPGFDVNYPMNFGDQAPDGSQWIVNADAIANLPDINNPLRTPTVAVIDLGIDGSHPVFQDKLYEDTSNLPLGKDDCYPDDQGGVNLMNPTQPPYDDITGHGTHVAHIIQSLLPQVPMKIMSIQVGNDPSSATVFKVACGVEYAIRHEVDVVNISMGYLGERVPLLDTVMTTTEAKKILFVTSSGNDKANTDFHPHWPSNLGAEAGNDHILSVASFGRSIGGDFFISDLSNFGENTVNLAAPGENIYSAVNGGGYDYKSGTSMSAAFVSAFAAALKASNPDMQPKVMVEKMMGTNITVQEASFAGKIKGARRLNIELIDCSLSPFAAADSAQLTWSEWRSHIDVYANDCRGSQNQSPNIVSPPQHGSLSWDSDSLVFVYQPNVMALLMGSVDSFTYEICSVNANPQVCDSAEVGIKKQGIGIIGIVILVLLLLLIIVALIRRL